MAQPQPLFPQTTAASSAAEADLQGRRHPLDPVRGFVQAYSITLSGYSTRAWLLDGLTALLADAEGGHPQTQEDAEREGPDVQQMAAAALVRVRKPQPFERYALVRPHSLSDSALRTSLKAYGAADPLAIPTPEMLTPWMGDWLTAFQDARAAGRDVQLLVWIEPELAGWGAALMQALKGLPVVVGCVLAPTATRRWISPQGLLTETGWHGLERGLGLSRHDLHAGLDTPGGQLTLFGERTIYLPPNSLRKERTRLYVSLLKETFPHVSKPYSLLDEDGTHHSTVLIGSHEPGVLRIAHDLFRTPFRVPDPPRR